MCTGNYHLPGYIRIIIIIIITIIIIVISVHQVIKYMCNYLWGDEMLSGSRVSCASFQQSSAAHWCLMRWEQTEEPCLYWWQRHWHSLVLHHSEMLGLHQAVTLQWARCSCCVLTNLSWKGWTCAHHHHKQHPHHHSHHHQNQHRCPHHLMNQVANFSVCFGHLYPGEATFERK